jgi:hypothetical protein
MRLSTAIALAAALSLAGCGWSHNVGAKINLDSVGLADRCANLMKAAMPFADIDIGQRSSKSTSISAITASVEGTRTDLPKDAPGDRALAVECQFDDGILSGFHWTKGGPTPRN